MPRPTKKKTTPKPSPKAAVKKPSNVVANKLGAAKSSTAGPKVGDPAALAQLAQIEKTYAVQSSSEAHDRFAMGTTLLPARAGKLYRARGIPTFEEYAEKVLHLDRRQAIDLTDEVLAYTEEQFARLDPTHARLGLLLLRATPEQDTVADLETMKLRHGSGQGRPFTEATGRQILEDIAGERGKHPAQHTKLAGVSNDEEIYAIAVFNKLSANGVGGMNVEAKPTKHGTRMYFDITIGDFALAVTRLAPLIAKIVPKSIKPTP